MRFSHLDRLELIYLVTVHGIPMKKLAKEQAINYTTLYSILRKYWETGRTNRLLIHQEKISRLTLNQKRAIKLQSQLTAKQNRRNDVFKR